MRIPLVLQTKKKPTRFRTAQVCRLTRFLFENINTNIQGEFLFNSEGSRRRSFNSKKRIKMLQC